MSNYKNPVCRGSWSLGNNCKKCERCIDTRPPGTVQTLKPDEVPIYKRTELGDKSITEIKDIPKGIQDELERLHLRIADNGGNICKENRIWAMRKIDNIHKMLFTATWLVSDEDISK